MFLYINVWKRSSAAHTTDWSRVWFHSFVNEQRFRSFASIFFEIFKGIFKSRKWFFLLSYLKVNSNYDSLNKRLHGFKFKCNQMNPDAFSLSLKFAWNSSSRNEMKSSFFFLRFSYPSLLTAGIHIHNKWTFYFFIYFSVNARLFLEFLN